jgi:adenine-specific DNA-methyltransferase
MNQYQQSASFPSAIEYIGSKRQLLDFIVDSVNNGVNGSPKEIADIFSGTGVVSSAFKSSGYRVFANDHLATCFNLTMASLLNNNAPSFLGLDSSITRIEKNPYLSVLKFLNDLPPVKGGFIHVNYSPESMKFIGYERRYFTEYNSAKIDAIRSKISEWEGVLTKEERSLLLSDLIKSVTAVSNVAGTYGCYLKSWKKRALNQLELKPSHFIEGIGHTHTITCLDAKEAITIADTPIVYADPPYTKRQYAAYYHILETIVRNDNPIIAGTTGLRDWKTHSSDFCYKRKAESALESLLNSTNCEHFFLSYNDDGQISHGRLNEILSSYGSTKVHELDIKRYRSSSLPHKGPTVIERLYHTKVRK